MTAINFAGNTYVNQGGILFPEFESKPRVTINHTEKMRREAIKERTRQAVAQKPQPSITSPEGRLAYERAQRAENLWRTEGNRSWRNIPKQPLSGIARTNRQAGLERAFNPFTSYTDVPPSFSDPTQTNKPGPFRTTYTDMPPAFDKPVPGSKGLKNVPAVIPKNVPAVIPKNVPAVIPQQDISVIEVQPAKPSSKMNGCLKKLGKWGAIAGLVLGAGLALYKACSSKNEPTAPVKTPTPADKPAPADKPEPKEPVAQETDKFGALKGSDYWKYAEAELLEEHAGDAGYKPTNDEINKRMFEMVKRNEVDFAEDGVHSNPLLMVGDEVELNKGLTERLEEAKKQLIEENKDKADYQPTYNEVVKKMEEINAEE